MDIYVLAENTSVSDEYDNEHGLSIYVEAKGRRLLFDMGASSLFAKNAKKLGLDLSLVDAAIVSHGHYDHGGGLGTFLQLNDKAKIYINKKAFEGHFARREEGETYIGLDKKLAENERIILTGDHYVIEEGIILISGVKDQKLNPSGNKELLMQKHGEFVCDDFSHEQSLLVQEGNNEALFAGCSHKGIVNILEHIRHKGYPAPTHVIGGFHMYSRSGGRYEDISTLEKTGAYLRNTGSSYYTCHCTGINAYKRLKEIIGERVEYLATGSRLKI
jgi:7,8-dihydropterin-6-yl-methyl-4-(beta-D-ribofuranosyl)aminobenzene 5'-phosphate synthase